MFHLFVSLALICFVLYLRKIILSKICILYCLVPLNSINFKHCLIQSAMVHSHQRLTKAEYAQKVRGQDKYQ